MADLGLELKSQSLKCNYIFGISWIIGKPNSEASMAIRAGELFTKPEKPSP
jgi:hypothetical protein